MTAAAASAAPVSSSASEPTPRWLDRPFDAVLWDCDGVLQHGIAGALDELAARVGIEVLPTLFAEELPALRGEEPLADAVRRVLAAHDLDLPIDEVLSIWDEYVLDPDALAVLQEVRELGIPCHLATNQQDYRRDGMRAKFDHLVDGSFYSCEMRTCKPEAAYFRHICAALRVEPGRLLFIDDLEPNVAAALEVGLMAEVHDPAAGAAGLRELLGRNGIHLG